MKYLYTKNYKTLIKETEDDLKKWKDIPCSLIGRINSSNGQNIQRNLQIYYNPYQITYDIFHRIEQIILKFIWNHKRLRIARAHLRKKQQSRRHNPPRL